MCVQLKVVLSSQLCTFNGVSCVTQLVSIGLSLLFLSHSLCACANKSAFQNKRHTERFHFIVSYFLPLFFPPFHCTLVLGITQVIWTSERKSTSLYLPYVMLFSVMDFKCHFLDSPWVSVSSKPLEVSWPKGDLLSVFPCRETSDTPAAVPRWLGKS